MSEAKITTAEMREAMLRHWDAPRFETAFEVRNDAGFGANRSCDAMVCSSWPSDGLLLHGFEIKVSRSDFLNEIKDPWKAEAFAKYCDLWSFAVAKPDIIKPGELPPEVGIFVLSRGTLKAIHTPTKRATVEPMPRGMLASMMRRMAVGPREELNAVKKAEYERGYEDRGNRKRSIVHRIAA